MDPRMETHTKSLMELEPKVRYEGYDMKKLLALNLLRFDSEQTCGTCGNPLSQPYCGHTGAPHSNVANAIPPLGAAGTDPFAGIVKFTSDLPDFTYGVAKAEVHGYRKPLHDDVVSRAKDFLAAHFDERADRVK